MLSLCVRASVAVLLCVLRQLGILQRHRYGLMSAAQFNTTLSGPLSIEGTVGRSGTVYRPPSWRTARNRRAIHLKEFFRHSGFERSTEPDIDRHEWPDSEHRTGGTSVMAPLRPTCRRG